jgi:hypothetical protein
MLPFIFVQIPLWGDLITPHPDLCYMFVDEMNAYGTNFIIIVTQILVWEGPLFIYLLYGTWIGIKLITVFSGYEDEMKQTIKYLKLKVLSITTG